MKITVTGLAGSGKSTIAKLLAEKFDCKVYSAGNFQRELAEERGLSIAEWGELEAKDKSFDIMVDNKFKEVADSEENAVFDAWLGAYFAPKAIKVFLECDELVRVERRMPQKRETEQYSDVQEAIKSMNERMECNRKRWIEFYKFDFLDMTNYDFIIKVTTLTPEQIVAQILEFVDDFK